MFRLSYDQSEKPGVSLRQRAGISDLFSLLFHQIDMFHRHDLRDVHTERLTISASSDVPLTLSESVCPTEKYSYDLDR